MDGKVENAIEVTLVLTETEARWLKRLVQNPTCAPDLEHPEHNAMRGQFWHTLEGLGVK